MNASQDIPSIGFVSQADFASEVLQSGKPVLAVFMSPWSRAFQVLEATLNEVVPPATAEWRSGRSMRTTTLAEPRLLV
jgi:thioredoxin-like negative regulator of GroEL